jgi:hypothetical protein
LFVILAVAIHFSVPFIDAAADRDGVDLEQKRPDGFTVEEILKTFSATVLQQLIETSDIVFCLPSCKFTLVKILSRDS